MQAFAVEYLCHITIKRTRAAPGKRHGNEIRRDRFRASAVLDRARLAPAPTATIPHSFKVATVSAIPSALRSCTWFPAGEAMWNPAPFNALRFSGSLAVAGASPADSTPRHRHVRRLQCRPRSLEKTIRLSLVEHQIVYHHDAKRTRHSLKSIPARMADLSNRQVCSCHACRHIDYAVYLYCGQRKPPATT